MVKGHHRGSRRILPLEHFRYRERRSWRASQRCRLPQKETLKSTGSKGHLGTYILSALLAIFKKPSGQKLIIMCILHSNFLPNFKNVLQLTLLGKFTPTGFTRRTVENAWSSTYKTLIWFPLNITRWSLPLFTL